MKIARWICFIPVAAIAAVAIAAVWGQIVPSVRFGTSSFADMLGAAPALLGRALGVGTFIVTGAAIAPTRGKLQIIILAVIGGICGAPFGEKYELGPAGPVLFAVECTGTFLGVALGALVAFKLFRAPEPGAQAEESRSTVR